MQVSSISAMQANTVEFAVSAHNVANLSTPDFRAQDVQRLESSSGGVSIELSRNEELGVEIVDEMIRQKRLVFNHEAQLKTFIARDEMLGSLLDIIA